MEDFKSYLLSKRIVHENKLVYYELWVSQCYNFCKKNLGGKLTDNDIDKYTLDLRRIDDEHW